MSGNSYKQYQRTQRIIRTEDNYSGGMMYVNTPLDTGYSRVILNLDLAENSLGLKPRAGLRTFVSTDPVDKSSDLVDLKPNLFCKANSVMRRASDGTVKYTDTIIVEKDVYKVGPYSDEESYPITRLTHAATDEEAALYFDKTKAHCFAWQGDLYHMHEDGLYHFNDTSLHAKVSPRALTPKEAVNAGYNMLSENPYSFGNIESVATSGDILGILPYNIIDKDTDTERLGELALNPKPNVPIALKIILAVANSADVKYQCKLEWRESTQGSWTDIELDNATLKYDESSTDGMSGADILKTDVYAYFPLPETAAGTPIYIRATLKVASENETAYSIGSASYIKAGSVLGAGTSIGDLTSTGLQFKVISGAQTSFPTTVVNYISNDAVIKADTYIAKLYCNVVNYALASVFPPGFKYYENAEDPEESYYEASEYFNVSYRDSVGVYHDISYTKNCIDRDTNIFTLAPGVTLFWSRNTVLGKTHHTGYLEGPVSIPLTYTASAYEEPYARYDMNLRIEGAFNKGRQTWTNIYAVRDYSSTEAIEYTIGAGTQLQADIQLEEDDYLVGDYLNNTTVYVTTTLRAPVTVGAGEAAKTATVASSIAPTTSVVSFVFNKNNATNSVIKYDLATAKGMCFWKERLVLWGVASPETSDTQYQEDSTNLMFFSELNDPSYFPYPQNVSVFTEPVLKALPFGDDLLVITATSMHLIGLNEDGLSWTTVQIQSNLRFREDEMHLVQVVNNMVLFKSGPQFYLLVPSTTNIGNLVVAPITKNIKSIFDNPTSFIKRLFIQLFSTEEYKSLLAAVLDLNATAWVVNTIVDFESIHITYTAQFEYDDKTIQPTVDFIYNTTSRVWKVYLYSTTPGHVLIRKDAVKMGVYTSIVEVEDEENNQLAFQYRTFDSTKVTDDIEGIEDIFSNLHFLDTGMRNQDNAYNKRYREAQLKLSNHTSAPLQFYLEYALDGVVYLPLYAPELNTSVDNSDTTVSDLVYNFREPLIVTGTPVLTKTVNDTIDYNTEDDIPLLIGYAHDQTDDMYAFTIEPGVESMLEAPFTLKLRSTILGKGYAPSLKVYSRNTTDFTILDHTWVYRIMNAR